MENDHYIDNTAISNQECMESNNSMMPMYKYLFQYCINFKWLYIIDVNRHTLKHHRSENK
jgi:hypothetical protein